MNRGRLSLVFLCVLSFAIGTVSPITSAQATSAVEDSVLQEVSRLIVQYEESVPLTEAPNEATGSSVLENNGLIPETSLGDGLAVVRLDTTVESVEAAVIVDQLTADPRIVWAEPDRLMQIADAKSQGRDTSSRPTTSPNERAVLPSLASASRPLIDSISPILGSTLGETRVVVRGQNLSDVTRVAFGGRAARILSQSALKLVVRTRPHASGVVDLTVRNPVGSRRLAGAFTYVAPLWEPTELTYRDGTLWGLTGLYGVNAVDGWQKTRGAGETVVAVIDTGSTVHSDSGLVVPGYDFVSDALIANDGDARDSNPSDPGDWITANEANGTAAGGYFLDCEQTISSWHGTHVSGIVNAAANGFGTVGIAPSVSVEHVRVLGKCGGYLSDILAGIIWAAGGAVDGVPANAYPADVINLSLGGLGDCSLAEQTAIDFALSQNIPVVVAAGNEDRNASRFSPANCDGVVTVAATDSAGKRAAFSNYGGTVEVSAPGVSIYSTLNSGQRGPVAESYESYSGTSMATPFVAGLVALMLTRSPGLSPPAVLSTLQSSTLTFPGGRCDDLNILKTCGTGIVSSRAIQ